MCSVRGCFPDMVFVRLFFAISTRITSRKAKMCYDKRFSNNYYAINKIILLIKILKNYTLMYTLHNAVTDTLRSLHTREWLFTVLITSSVTVLDVTLKEV